MSEYITGRPTKYIPAYCDMLIKHMGEGLSFESFAATIGVNRDTLYNWKVLHSDFSDALKKAVEANLLYWEMVGRQIAVKNKGNVAGWIFNMKNRHKWKDNHEITTEGNGLINITIKERDGSNT